MMPCSNVLPCILLQNYNNSKGSEFQRIMAFNNYIFGLKNVKYCAQLGKTNTNMYMKKYNISKVEKDRNVKISLL